MDEDKRLRVADHVRWLTTAQGTVLLETKEGKIFTLDPLGSRIWTDVQAGLSVQAIIDNISREFGVPRELAARDVKEFVTTLKAYSLAAEQQ